MNNEGLTNARVEATRRLLYASFDLPSTERGDSDLHFALTALELAVIDLLNKEDKSDSLHQISADAFQLRRVLSRPEQPLDAGKLCLRLACLGVLGDRSADAAKLLKDQPWPDLPIKSANWGERTLAIILDIWLRLIRKDGWKDFDEVQNLIIGLRSNQKDFEAQYLSAKDEAARTAAWELIALYHLSKGAEILGKYLSQGQVDGYYDIRQQLEAQFDPALLACARAELIELEVMIRILARTAQQLVDNSIWAVTIGVQSEIIRFVESMVSRNNPHSIFELLPPQRKTLREEGLLGSGHRAVVVNLPTSSGKTFIAEFRILQALNQFENERGWIVYLAPTRALINQICARLRRDFAALPGIIVERVSPALEVDALEANLLSDASTETNFRILVTTPEKLDLMLRGDWEKNIGRPLTLVVVDEAHNLAQKDRGLKLELLLATINRECRYAQFLLLTPFISNASELARWLDPQNNKDIQLNVNWQPNDRAVVLSYPKQGEKSGDYSLYLETIHTNRETLMIPEILPLGNNRPLGFAWSDVNKNSSNIAAATAQKLKSRGPVIVLTSTIPWAWNLARKFKHSENRKSVIEKDTELTQRYLSYEFGPEFELIDLLNFGIGVHHSGLSDEAKILIERLFENKAIQILVATTTIAQGVNFPVSAVVLAQNKFFDEGTHSMVEMPPEDFWNLAGRAGRIGQDAIGIIALAATVEPGKSEELRTFVTNQVLSLNSTLIDLVQTALQMGTNLNLHTLYSTPGWSAFLQYLAHSYRQIGDPQKFANDVELVLRGTLGFQTLRRDNKEIANLLVRSVHSYARHIEGKPLKLVDNTGFSWESVNATLARLSTDKITDAVWDPNRLFQSNNRDLAKLMGILLQVPELKANLLAVTGGSNPDGDKLARIVRDWVNGAALSDIAREHFSTSIEDYNKDRTKALTVCSKNLFGKLSQTASWGLSALQTLTFKDRFDNLPLSEQQVLRNLPARVFYGVNTDAAVALRVLGVPRGAAGSLAQFLGEPAKAPSLAQVRETLKRTDATQWSQALGTVGSDYFDVWKILEG